MKWTRFCLTLLVCLTALTSTRLSAQSVPAGEPDTDAFLDANFQLQDAYARVLCVAGDTACPSQITASVPCLTAACSRAPAPYTVEASFSTIQEAVDSAQPGDLVIIMPGRYAGIQVEETGGEDGAYIHLLGWGEPGSVIIDSNSLRHHFYFIAAHHYILQNLAFEGADDGAGIFISGYFSGTGQFAHHFIVANVYSHDNGVWGLHTTSTNYVVIQDSIFTNSREEHGAYISGSGDNMVIRRSVFQGNNAGGLQVNADPQTALSEVFYWLQSATGDTCGWTDADVEFEGAATWDDIQACYDQQGLPDLGEFFEDGVSEGMIVEQNVVTGNGQAGGAGINLASVRRSTVRNNLIYGNAAAGIACWDNAYAEQKGLGSSEFGCQDVTIANNTVVDSDGDRGAVILSNDARNLTVANNVIVRERDDAFEIVSRSAGGLQSSHNYLSALAVDDPAGAVMLDSDPASGSTIAPSVADALGNFVAPGFEPWLLEDDAWPALNPDRPDYHLRADSLLTKGADGSLAPVYDLDGSVRSGLEIGALAAAGAPAAAVPSAVLPTEVASAVSISTASSPPAETATVAQAPVPADLFVDDDNTTGVEDGSAQNPFATVQQAIDSAADGAVIAVAAGTYTQNVRVQDKSVQIYGGFAGAASSDYAAGAGGVFDLRDPAANPSHLQGDGQDSVVTLIEAGTTLVDGFRITGGSRSLEGQPYCCSGGGVYVSGGVPTLANNLIENNDTRTAAEPDAEMVGGGVVADGADITILDNVVRNNTSGRGAGLAIFGGNVVIRGNTVEGNVGVSDHGGGIYIASPNAEISHNRIVGNEIGRGMGYGWGGGIIVFSSGSMATLSYNVITGNFAPSVGSGVFIDDGASAVLDHELIYANACTEMGGVGIYVDGAGNGGPGSTLQLMNSTVAGHDCPTAGGNALYVEQDSAVTIQNSILWGNGGDDVVVFDTAAVSATYTLSEESLPGTGNLTADPMFADPASHDYHLRSTVGRWDAAANGGAGGWVQDAEHSPAIDAGDPTTPFATEPEPNGGQVDMGAYGNTAEASLSAR